MFNESIKTVSDWGLINKDHNNADAFYCMSMKGYNGDMIDDCLRNKKQVRLD